MLNKLIILIFPLFLIVPTVSASTLSEVEQYLGQGSYDLARKALLSVNETGLPGEDALWESKLAGTPTQALEILNRSYKDMGMPVYSRIAIGLEIARIESASGQDEAVVSTLKSLIDHPEAQLPGEVYYLLGRSYRSLGRLQKAREMLASVKPADAVFSQSRFFLGDIGLQQNDATLALHYFDAALESETNPQGALAQAGRWLALRQLGEDKQAEKLYEDLQKQCPGSLALLEIRGHLQGEKEELAARLASQPANEVIAIPTETSGRFSLQLGAFSDRSLALEFQRKFLNQMPELSVQEIRDSHGQFMYKLRMGNYANPAQARTDAKMWSDKLGTAVIVIDLNQ